MMLGSTSICVCLTTLFYVSYSTQEFVDCPGIEPMKDFNLGMFLGEWYEVANYGDDGDRNGVCPKFTFTHENGNINLENIRMKNYPRDNMMDATEKTWFVKKQRGLITGYEQTSGLIQPTGRFIFDYKKDNFKDQDIDNEFQEQIDVISTDYKTYAVINTCTAKAVKVGGFGFGKKSIGWLLSRTPEIFLTDEEKDKLYKTFDAALSKISKRVSDYKNIYLNKDKCFQNGRFKDHSKRYEKPWEDFTNGLEITEAAAEKVKITV